MGDMHNLTLGDLKGKRARLVGLDFPGLEPIQRLARRVARALEPVTRMAQRVSRWKPILEIAQADAKLPADFIERTDAIRARGLAYSRQLREAFDVAAPVYWQIVGRRSDGGRIRGAGSHRRRDGNFYIIACLRRAACARNLSSRQQIRLMHEAFGESPHIIKKAWNGRPGPRRKYRTRVKAQLENFPDVIDLRKLRHNWTR